MKAKSTTDCLTAVQSKKRKLDEENVATNTNTTATVVPPSLVNEPRTAYSEQAMDELSTYYAVLLSNVDRFKHKHVRLASLIKLLSYLKKRINITDTLNTLILTPPVEVTISENGTIQESVAKLLTRQSDRLYVVAEDDDGGVVDIDQRMRDVLNTRRKLEECLSRQHLCDIMVMEQLSTLLGAIPCYSTYLHKAFAWHCKVVIRNRLVDMMLSGESDITDTAKEIYASLNFFINFQIDSRLLFDRNVNDNTLESMSFLIDRLNQSEYDLCSPGAKHVCFIDVHSDASKFPLMNTKGHADL